MSALSLYEKLRGPERAFVRKRALALAGRPLNSAFVDAIDHPDHPALRGALRDWWSSTVTGLISLRIDSSDRGRELGILVCAESVSHLTNDPRVTECLRVRLAWARGNATDPEWWAARSFASNVVRDSWALGTSDPAAQAAAAGSTWHAFKHAAQAVAQARGAEDITLVYAAFAAPLRTLYPDPCAIDLCDGLTRFDLAVAEARAAVKAIGAR